MKVKIYKYEHDGKIYTDSYLENDKLVSDYSDAELFERDIPESKILEKSKELLNDYSYCMALVKNHPELMEGVYDLSINYLRGEMYRGDLKEKVLKILTEDAISHFVEDLINEIETNKKGNYENN